MDPQLLANPREAVALFEALREAADDLGLGLTITDGDRFAYASPALARIYGYSVEELMAMSSFLPIVAPEERDELEARLRERATGQRRTPRDSTVVVRKDGSRAAIEYVLRTLRSPRGTFHVALVRDTTEERAADAVLRLHSAIVSAMSEGVCLLRVADATIAYTNPKFDRMLGYEPGELLGKPLTTISKDDAMQSAPHMVAEVIGQLIKTGEATYEVRIARKDDSVIHCRVNTTGLEHPQLGPVWVCVHEDITERKEIQSKLILSDRLASVGTLAAGVAHEINNPLASVMASLDVIADEVASLADVCPPSRLRELQQVVEDARVGAERVRRIVRGLRVFSRADEEKRTRLDVRVVLEKALGLVSNEIRHRATLARTIGPVPLVEADESRLAQVF
ncbi:MAG TPA: PAS domain S-box protein, partial [Polyangiaceae bacterium]|nr:PAS domain S-box protein [Polyangiaceae bacterium]